jgi:hypothetical protein
MSLGAHALGALEPQEAVLVEAHLATCPDCREELAELGGLTVMLARVGEADIEQAGRPPQAVLERLIATSVRRRRTNRLMLGLAASLVTVALGGAALAVVTGGQPERSTAAPAALAPTPNPAGGAEANKRGAAQDSSGDQPLLATSSALPPPESPLIAQGEAAGRLAGERDGVTAQLTMTPGAEGTAIVVRLSGVPGGTSCRVTAVGRDGTKAPAGSWTVEAADYHDGAATFTGHTELSAEAIEGFDISTSTGKRLLWLPLRS